MSSEKLYTLVNEQITHELGAEMQYLAISCWLERENFHGMAAWFKQQAIE
jgi:ferritin